MKKYILILILLSFKSFGVMTGLLSLGRENSIKTQKSFFLRKIEKLKKGVANHFSLDWEYTFSSLQAKYPDFRLYSLDKKKQIVVDEYFDGNINKYNEVEDLLLKRINHFLPFVTGSKPYPLSQVKQSISYLAMGMYSSKVEVFVKEYLTKNKDLVKISNFRSSKIYEYINDYFKLCLLGLRHKEYREEFYSYLEHSGNKRLLFYKLFLLFIYASGEKPLEARDYALQLLSNKRKTLLKSKFTAAACIDVIFGTDRDLKFVENIFLDKDFYANRDICMTALEFLRTYRQKITNEAVVEKIYQLTFHKDKILRGSAIYTLLNTFTKDKAWVEEEALKATDPERKKRLENCTHPNRWREGYSFGPLTPKRKKQINNFLGIKEED